MEIPMNERRKIEKLQKHVETLQKQVDRLTAENDKLRNENEAIKLKIDESDSVISEFEEMLRNTRKAKEAYSSAMSELLNIKTDFIKDFNGQLRRIKKQK